MATAMIIATMAMMVIGLSSGLSIPRFGVCRPPGRTGGRRSDRGSGFFLRSECGRASDGTRPGPTPIRDSESPGAEAQALGDVVIRLAERDGVVDVQRSKRRIPDQAGADRRANLA